MYPEEGAQFGLKHKDNKLSDGVLAVVIIIKWNVKLENLGNYCLMIMGRQAVGSPKYNLCSEQSLVMGLLMLGRRCPILMPINKLNLFIVYLQRCCPLC